jgi:diguanylate cyclase (GGDEF)-like protein
VKEAIESGFPLSLVMIDVDKFKQVNDTHGHPIGDDLLLAIATTIANRARGKGKAYRYGRGDEMAILLPNYSKMEAAALAETIRIEFERSRITDKKLTVTASFGVAAVPEDAQVGKDLLNLADSSLLSAKKLGRNLVRAVGDVDEPKESPAPRRKQPTSEALSGEQEAAIRTTYFRGRTPECPKDGALLRVTEFKEVGFKTPSLLVNCPGCGLQVHIRGV